MRISSKVPNIHIYNILICNTSTNTYLYITNSYQGHSNGRVNMVEQASLNSVVDRLVHACSERNDHVLMNEQT